MSTADKQTLENLKNGPTLFAYEKASGKFVIGYITNNTMFVHTDGDDLLVADADGVLSSLAYTTDDLKDIQSAANEHFETSTFGITAIQSFFAIGDSLPNWNAYEKIVYIEIAKVKLRWSSTVPPEYLFGNVKRDINNNDILVLQCYNSENNEAFIVKGEKITRYYNLSETAQQNIIKRMQNVYPQVNEIQFDKTNKYSIGDSIQNWDEYEEIGYIS